MTRDEHRQTVLPLYERIDRLMSAAETEMAQLNFYLHEQKRREHHGDTTQASDADDGRTAH